MKKILIAVLLTGLSFSVVASEKANVERLSKVLESSLDAKPDNVRPSAVKGIYEAHFGGQMFYITANGEHLFTGELFELKTRSNLTERSRSQGRIQFIEQLAESEMIQYKANGKEKHVITVFTDIDCGYCRRMHRGMKEMNDLGITVRYMAFPRSAVGSSSYNKSVSVWCAKDQRQAMDNAKLNERIDSKACDDNPVAKHMSLGQQLGVTGTPSILLADGSLIPGYMPPEKLLETLEQNKAAR